MLLLINNDLEGCIYLFKYDTYYFFLRLQLHFMLWNIVPFFLSFKVKV